jgi:hypothetical protein
MIIELTKKVNKIGDIVYFIKVDNEFVPGSVTLDIASATVMYDNVKSSYTLAREEALMREEI